MSASLCIKLELEIDMQVIHVMYKNLFKKKVKIAIAKK